MRESSILERFLFRTPKSRGLKDCATFAGAASATFAMGIPTFGMGITTGMVVAGVVLAMVFVLRRLCLAIIQGFDWSSLAAAVDMSESDPLSLVMTTDCARTCA